MVAKLREAVSRIHWTTKLIIFVLAALGADLILQPARFSRTPSYANLIRITPAQTWGICYLAAAALLLSSICTSTHRDWSVAVHTLAGTLIAVWLGAFIFRWLSDPATTAVNVESWIVYLTLITRSAVATISTGTANGPRSST